MTFQSIRAKAKVLKVLPDYSWDLLKVTGKNRQKSYKSYEIIWNHQKLLRWNLSNRQMRFYGRLTPGQADALRRQTDAELRRDTVEAMLLEEIVIEEPLSWAQLKQLKLVA